MVEVGRVCTFYIRHFSSLYEPLSLTIDRSYRKESIISIVSNVGGD
jgi:hypothetical protein